MKIILLSIIIKRNMRIHLTFLLHMMLMLSWNNGLNWQGAGNFNTADLTNIWTYIGSHFSTISTDKTTISPEVTALSTYLNDLWDPAWNVVLVYDNTPAQNLDSVLYGYGYNNHWMWSNGILLSSGNYISIVIWKDYNCVGWQTINSASTTSYDATTTANLEQAISDFTPKASLNDIWATAFAFMPFFSTYNPIFTSYLGYSIIISQSTTVDYYGQVCVANYYDNSNGKHNIGTDGPNGNWGSSLILQMVGQ